MSSTILTVIVLVVMWLVVLVPMFVRLTDEEAEQTDDPAEYPPAAEPRLLARRVVPEPPGPEEFDTEEPTSLDELMNSDPEPTPAPSVRSRMLTRRRRTLATLGGLSALTMVVAVLMEGRTGAWLVQGLCDLLLAGYLIGLRREVRRERVRRAVRLARATAVRARASASRTVRATPPRRPAARPAPQTHVHPVDPEEYEPEHRRVVGE